MQFYNPPVDKKANCTHPKDKHKYHNQRFLWSHINFISWKYDDKKVIFVGNYTKACMLNNFLFIALSSRLCEFPFSIRRNFFSSAIVYKKAIVLTLKCKCVIVAGCVVANDIDNFGTRFNLDFINFRHARPLRWRLFRAHVLRCELCNSFISICLPYFECLENFMWRQSKKYCNCEQMQWVTRKTWTKFLKSFPDAIQLFKRCEIKFHSFFSRKAPGNNFQLNSCMKWKVYDF